MNKTVAFTTAALLAIIIATPLAAQQPAQAPAPAAKTCIVTGPAGNRVQLTGVACDRAKGAQVQGALGNSGAYSSAPTANGGRVTQGAGETALGGQGAYRRETGPGGVTASGQRSNALGGSVSAQRSANGQSSASTTQRETALGGGWRTQRQVGPDGATVSSQGRNALGGEAQASRTVSADGVTATVSGRNFFGGSYTCSRSANYAAGRTGQVTCTGPGGVTYGGGTVAKVNPDGTVDLIMRNARGEEVIVSAVTVR